jgi:hypothetical protein
VFLLFLISYDYLVERVTKCNVYRIIYSVYAMYIGCIYSVYAFCICVHMQTLAHSEICKSYRQFFSRTLNDNFFCILVTASIKHEIVCTHYPDFILVIFISYLTLGHMCIAYALYMHRICSAYIGSIKIL